MISKNGFLIFLTFVSHAVLSQDPLLQNLRKAEVALLMMPSQGDASSYLDAVSGGISLLQGEPRKHALTELAPEDQFVKRLEEIWQLRLKNPEWFKQMDAFLQPGPPDVILEIVRKSQRVLEPSRLSLPVIPVSLMHPEVRASVDRYPKHYDQFLQLRKETYLLAEQIFDNGGLSLAEIEPQFESQFEQIVGPYRNDPIMIPHLQNLMAAAQLPGLGSISPGFPRLDPIALPAWEELVLRVPQLDYKQLLISVITPFSTESTSASFGMVLKQAVNGYKSNPQDKLCEELIHMLLDYYRDFPCSQAVVALAQAKKMANTGPDAFELPIGRRLEATGWPSLLAEMMNSESLKPFAAELALPPK